MSTVDIHSHAIPPSVIEAIEADPTGFSARIEGKGKERHVVHDQGYAYPLFEEFVDPATKLQAMDGKGLDISVLSPPPPLFYYWADAKTGAHIARLVNDGIGELVSTKPARFRGTASVPMQYTEAAIAELERVVSAYGFRAVEVGTSVEGAQLADVAFRPLLERASELGVLILAHPYYVGAKQGLEDYYLTNLLENPYDSTVMIANLMFSGLLEELPSLKLCVAHGADSHPTRSADWSTGTGCGPKRGRTRKRRRRSCCAGCSSTPSPSILGRFATSRTSSGRSGSPSAPTLPSTWVRRTPWPPLRLCPACDERGARCDLVGYGSPTP